MHADVYKKESLVLYFHQEGKISLILRPLEITV